MKPIAVVAIGGNSLARPGERSSFEEQRRRVRSTCEGIADVLAAGYRVVVTHGNGPQVGEALLRAELAQPELPPVPLDACDAETQGLLGYLLQQALDNVLAARSKRKPVVSIVTQVLVDRADPAFRNPTKPIGPFYRSEEALERKHTLGWAMVEDSGRGWRRVVPSPQPIAIVELPAIRACLNAGAVVIAGGGGGIPVARGLNGLEGVEAVIDKDRVSALLAVELHASLLLFSTGVNRVARHFGRPDEQWWDRLTWAQANQYLQDGEFPPGSMGPKIEAALDFLKRTGGWAIITSPESIAAALKGKAGTVILPPLRVRGERIAAA